MNTSHSAAETLAALDYVDLPTYRAAIYQCRLREQGDAPPPTTSRHSPRSFGSPPPDHRP